tara:strand:- start:84 stop:1748 length:1665 start_codon:yes stop_codon:yes gene_type:complete
LSVDYLSILNQKGSGLNITQIVDSLVEADTIPKKNMLEEDKTVKQTEISAFASLASELNLLKADLSSMANSNKYVPVSGNSNLEISVSDNSVATAFSSDITINSLATQQTLQFSGSSPYTSPTAAIGQGTLTLNLGTWDASGSAFTNKSTPVTHTVTVDANNNTLQGLASSINALTDISASVLQTSAGVYSLVVKSPMGEDNAIQITTADANLFDFRADPTISGAPSNAQKQAASDAELIVDGITIKRTSNSISNIFSGYTLDLKGETDTLTPANFNVTSSLDVDSAFTNAQTLVDRLNLTRNYFDELMDRGIEDGESGTLSKDPVMRSISNQIRKLTETNIVGFGANSRYLSELGIQTKRDGTLLIDERSFKDAVEKDPSSYDAIFNSSITSSNNNLLLSKTSFSKPTPGTYSYRHSSGDSYLDNIKLLKGTDSITGLDYYSAVDGDPAGITIIPQSSVSSASVYVGESMLDKMDSYIENILSSSGDIERRKSTLNQDLTDIDDGLLDINRKVDVIRERYLEQFSAMESAVTSLKGTSEYLENMVKSWSKDDN